ncbi:MAG: BMP family ABC transporter substrate-binding protein, partial [Anaerolineales bacterium]|nr:BMP family ABC transporter substrate-binding protein [Anaerolineales bacterium]
MSPSNTNSSLTKPGDPNHYDGYLRVSWNDNVQGEAAANYAYTTLGLTTAAIIDNGGTYSTGVAQAFSDEFATLGGTITTQKTIDPSDTSTIDNALTDIAGTPPALLYMPVFTSPEGLYILDNLPAGLAGVQLFGADGLYDPSVNTAANEEGLLLTNYDFTVTRNPDFVTKFLPAYVAKYGSGPTDNFHSHAYDAFMIIKAAIESVAVETSPGVHEIGRQALRNALYGTTNHNGLTGNITCDVNGDCADASMSVYQFHTDQFPPEYLAPEKVGLVMDPAGPGDLSFNYMALQGILQAETAFNIPITLYWPADYSEAQSSLERCADEGNGLCFGVGFGMATAIENAAASRSATNFALLDMSFDAPPTNLKGITFNVKEVGYLAGTLAGRMSASDTVGVVAGMDIPPVRSFVEGFRNGAQCSGNTDVLINYTGTFGDPTVGEAAAADMITLGADVIYGVAGPTGNGAILYSTQNGVWSIGV